PFIPVAIVQVERWNQHPLSQVLEPQALENALQDLLQILLIVIRSNQAADIAKVVKPRIIKNPFTVVPVKRNQLVHRFPCGQAERNDAAGGRAREQVRPLDEVGNLRLKSFQDGQRDQATNASAVE